MIKQSQQTEPQTKRSGFSHGQIAALDSFLRTALLGQAEKYPLSAALFASARLRGVPAPAAGQRRIGMKYNTKKKQESQQQEMQESTRL